MNERFLRSAVRRGGCVCGTLALASLIGGGWALAQETPVSVAAFESRVVDGATVIEWTTATEADNIGFNLYAKTAEGWRRVNDELIPTSVGDSAVPVSYSFRFEGLQASHFAIEDVDFRGAARMRGSFEAGGSYGSAVELREIDWAAVRSARAASAVGPARDSGKSGPAGSTPMAGRKMQFPRADLLVSQTGLHRVTHEELLEAGLDFGGAKAKELALSSRGKAVPATVGGGPRFGPGSYVEFYGEAVEGSLYTDTAPYRLFVDKKSAVRVDSDKARPKKKAVEVDFHMEELGIENNRFYSFASPIADPWYDTRMFTRTQPADFDFDLPVDRLAAGAGPVTLKVRLYGLSDLPDAPDHHLLVGLNGEWLLEDFSDGRDERSLEIEVPDGLLREGANTLNFRLAADLGLPFDVMLLESYGLSYPRRLVARDGKLGFSSDGEAIRVGGLDGAEIVAYRLDERGVSRLTAIEADGGEVVFRGTGRPSRYEVAVAEALVKPGIRATRPVSGLDSVEPADLLIVSHSDFVDALSPLTDAHASRGLRARVVAVEDLYERYSHGVVDPVAIRQHVRFAAENLGVRSVLLVGGDTYDYKDYSGAGSISFVPSLYAATGRSDQTSSGSAVRFAPVDPLFADLDGDDVPDLGIGRFPVRTTGELEQVIEKTIQFMNNGEPRTAVFAADNPDGELSFSEHSEEFISGMKGEWQVERAYMEELGLGPARELLMESINRGAALTSFVGHSSPTIWSFARLFQASDALSLENPGRPTMVMQWGCWNNYYVLPSYDTLGHEFLLQEGGAAAVLGSSTQTQAVSSERLSGLLAPWLTQPGLTLGEAITIAKKELARTHPEMLDVLLGWTLLGDPTLELSP